LITVRQDPVAAGDWPTSVGKVILILVMTLAGLVGSAAGQPGLHDPNLPTVKPEALRQLSDDRIKDKILVETQARYANRCVCPYMTRDAHGRSCKGRHEVVKSEHQAVCYPRQVTTEMVDDWRRRHP
jgi:hypothetical protein